MFRRVFRVGGGSQRTKQYVELFAHVLLRFYVLRGELVHFTPFTRLTLYTLYTKVHQTFTQPNTLCSPTATRVHMTLPYARTVWWYRRQVMAHGRTQLASTECGRHLGLPPCSSEVPSGLQSHGRVRDIRALRLRKHWRHRRR